MTTPSIIPAKPAAHRALLTRACAAQLLAVLGEHILLVTALPMWAYDLTQSATGVSLALIAVTAPALLSLPAGAWTSRFATRRVLLGCGALRLLLTALMLAARVALLGPAVALWTALGLAFAISLVDSFFMPALKAALPEWVTPDQLLRANSFLEATDIPGNLIGPPVAVLLYVRWGLPGAVASQAIAYLASLALLAGARFPRRAEARVEAAARLSGRMRHTLLLAWRSFVVRRTLIAWTAGMAALGIAEALILPFIREALHQPEELFGTFGALIGLGMALGAGLSAAWEPDWSDSELLAVAAAISTVALAVFAWSARTWLCGAALTVAGAGVIWVHVAATTLLQGKLPEEARAGMLGLAHSIEAGGLLVGLAAAGGLAARWGPRAILQVAVAILAAAAGLAIATAVQGRVESKS